MIIKHTQPGELNAQEQAAQKWSSSTEQMRLKLRRLGSPCRIIYERGPVGPWKVISSAKRL